MRADSTNVVQKESRGRDSIRIASKKEYSDSVIVMDLTHMPTGCATWTAFRTRTGEYHYLGLKLFTERIVQI